MPSCKEFEAKAVDQAVEKAAATLNIPKDKLKYNVISHGSSGIFGLVGAKKAKISVTLPEKEAPQNNGKGRKRNRRKGTSTPTLDIPTSESVSSLLRETFGEDAEPESSRDGNEADDEMCAGGEFENEAPENGMDVGPDAGPETGKDDPVPAKSEANSPAEPTEKPAPERARGQAPEPPAEIDPETLTEATGRGRDVLERIVDLISSDAEISVVSEDGGIRYNVAGGNAGVLIGKRGQTLEAIQYIVEKIVNKQAEGRVRVQVDVEGYLDNRKANLEELAQKLADKTRKSGKPSSLGHMSAHDRRIVHLALKDDGDVRTQSVGEGFYRKLVIFPNRKRRGRGK
jgi:spoIIIJ-associated protein